MSLSSKSTSKKSEFFTENFTLSSSHLFGWSCNFAVLHNLYPNKAHFSLYCRKCLFQTLYIYLHNSGQKHPPRGVPRKKCYENMKQMYRQCREHPALWHGCSPVNLLHIFRTPFLKNTSGWLLLSGCLLSIPLHFSKTYIAVKVSSNALLGF